MREFFIHNAMYWLQEYHFDGLRLDAVHAIIDDSNPHILVELARRVHAGIGQERHVHLVLENDANNTRYLEQGLYVAQWNDDIHHALHVLATGERDGYYMDYADDPVRHLGRCLAEGFAYQGEVSAYREHAPRGETSTNLPPQAFVSFLQSHDQAGNRAFGERITHIGQEAAVRAAVAVYLLAPSIPMLFMGEEFASKSPFRFFCDFGPELREAVTQGRRREFARFARFGDATMEAAIPDPNSPQTFLISKIDWNSLKAEVHGGWLDYYRKLLKLRRDAIIPRLPGMEGHSAHFEAFAPCGLRVQWQLGDGSTLRLLANFSSESVRAALPAGRVLFTSSPDSASSGAMKNTLGPCSVVWTLEPLPSAGEMQTLGRGQRAIDTEPYR